MAANIAAIFHRRTDQQVSAWEASLRSSDGKLAPPRALSDPEAPPLFGAWAKKQRGEEALILSGAFGSVEVAETWGVALTKGQTLPILFFFLTAFCQANFVFFIRRENGGRGRKRKPLLLCNLKLPDISDYNPHQL